ncbi:beta-galactosidase BglB [Latilactobacillus sakei]|uniref:beta-galactosidase BglB n=1 Tax=Latilactobacillus sakei TaxID=1599 RepID=UPI000DC6456F|nr:glycoside hydrolase family 88 protein [Latilactobacillus sakei]SPS04058.1 Unsaturated rhamnogalacturonyl hydrolase YesR [Latilactobacillus sakei]
MTQLISKKNLEGKIDLLIDNLVHLSDPTGEFSIKVADGSIIDNKSFNYWEWTSGIGLYGMTKYYELTRKPEILAQMIKWFDDQFEKEPVEKNINTMVQMQTLAFLYEETGDKKYLPYLKSWGKWLYEDLPRTERGGFQHVTFGDLNENEMWDDTLMMSVLTLAKLGKLFKNDDYIEEAKKQFLLHIQFLADKKTGLWYHGWNFNERNNFSGAFWGRGNSWITIAIPEFLELVDFKENDAVKSFLEMNLQYQIDTLAKYQADNGFWHTLVDDPDSYIEGSATAGFAYGILKSIHNHYISEDYREMGIKAVKAVLDNIDETGALAYVSAGTPMGETKDFYNNIKISVMPYGQSMATLCLCEYLSEFY